MVTFANITNYNFVLCNLIFYLIIVTNWIKWIMLEVVQQFGVFDVFAAKGVIQRFKSKVGLSLSF